MQFNPATGRFEASSTGIFGSGSQDVNEIFSAIAHHKEQVRSKGKIADEDEGEPEPSDGETIGSQDTHSEGNEYDLQQIQCCEVQELKDMLTENFKMIDDHLRILGLAMQKLFVQHQIANATHLQSPHTPEQPKPKRPRVLPPTILAPSKKVRLSR